MCYNLFIFLSNILFYYNAKASITISFNEALIAIRVLERYMDIQLQVFWSRSDLSQVNFAIPLF